ncbi:MAG: sulfatase [Planctomycetes bacterium]|nr:sulfatase [Planctomycetota bacterium]
MRRLFVVLAALSFVACRDSTAGARPNVLLVCVDTLRADRLGAYGYRVHPTSPAIDELAARSLVFENARAAACWTKPSVPSFFTGTYPLQHGVYEGSARALAGTVSDVLPDDAVTLAERFADAGYTTVAFVQNAQLRKGLGFEQGFGDRYVDGAGDAREIRWRLVDWLDERGDDDAPFFAYLHLLDAHWPYDIPDEYARKFSAGTSIEPFRGEDSRALRDALNDGSRKLDAAEAAGLVALYDGAVRSIDDQLAKLFAALERRGLADNTIVCLVADHGEEFLEHGRVGHGHGLWDGLLHVPFILHVPGARARRVSTPVALIDLVPTLCAAADVPCRGAVEGRNRLVDETVAPLFAEHKEPGAYVQSYVEGSKKLVRRFVAPAASAHGSLLDALQPGTRWEAECRAEDGAWEALEFARRDEAVADPFELKGCVAGLGAGTFELAGVTIELAKTCEFYGEMNEANARGAMLVEGLGVKARGRFVGNAFVAEKIKLYAASEDVKPEVRGSLTRTEVRGDAFLAWFGPLAVEFGPDTRWKDDAPRELSRDDVRRAQELGATAARTVGFTVDETLFDLAADPDEHAPLDDAVERERLSRGADELVRELLRRATSGGGERRQLDAGEVEDLRAIGYVK